MQGVISGPFDMKSDFKGVPSNVDAAFMDGYDTIFVKGDLYYRYIQGHGLLSPVKKSNTQQWKHLPKRINAAYYNYHLKQNFYFVGDKVLILNEKDNKVSYHDIILYNQLFINN